MKKQKEPPVDGTQEEWIPKTAHEIAVGMFHGLPNILVPARHHLAKMTGSEAKTAHKAVDRALTMVAECSAKMARVPGPLRAGFWDDKAFVIIESDTNRLEADYDGDDIQRVSLRHRKNSNSPWVTVWDSEEWTLEAILGAIIKMVTGEEIPVPACA